MMDKKRSMQDQVIAGVLCNGDPEQEISLLHELIDVELCKSDEEMDCDFISACVRQIHELEGRELETGITPEPKLFAKRAQRKNIKKKFVRAASIFLSFWAGLFVLNSISVTALNVSIIDGIYQWTDTGIAYHSEPKDPSSNFKAPETSTEMLLEKLKELGMENVWLPLKTIQQAGGVSNYSQFGGEIKSSVDFDVLAKDGSILFRYSIWYDSIVVPEGDKVYSGKVMGNFDKTDKFQVGNLTLYFFSGENDVCCLFDDKTPDYEAKYTIRSVLSLETVEEVMKTIEKVVL